MTATETRIQHTPGPWKVTPSSAVVVDSRGFTIANLQRRDSSHGDGERNANARLIAAAPTTRANLDDLLEAAEAAVMLIRDTLGDGVAPIEEALPIAEFLTEAIDQARA